MALEPSEPPEESSADEVGAKAMKKRKRIVMKVRKFKRKSRNNHEVFRINAC